MFGKCCFEGFVSGDLCWHRMHSSFYGRAQVVSLLSFAKIGSAFFSGCEQLARVFVFSASRLRGEIVS